MAQKLHKYSKFVQIDLTNMEFSNRAIIAKFLHDWESRAIKVLNLINECFALREEIKALREERDELKSLLLAYESLKAAAYMIVEEDDDDATEKR